ncbi:probable indole-3-pyruvate monooxygenase YUCCA11 [Dioscorea cayenensis subsp. rotundata]|uniref:indole-3-pyruvate monooxygenase n=1 Tax=Dioscorea cayennensis subsp. rotundata TaxID=55577 RepID=A0AB40C5E7_DIOCR|nr:probable indole-3-pyruvate monooxygenase YUCCA11 [Dioscorea cayenensis subsp. rotundata]
MGELEKEVIIVGGGPAGLATAACLKKQYISSMIILEREACTCSTWKLKTYDRVNLHLGKDFCTLPHFPHKKGTPVFISKSCFIDYLDEYVEFFNLKTMFNMNVISATFDADDGKWHLVSKNTFTEEIYMYKSKFVVVATGENAMKMIPEIFGLSTFPGEFIHSSEYKSPMKFAGKDVLVVGNGNSGMEIAYDLANSGVKTSILIRSPFHVMTREMVHAGMLLLKFLPIEFVDKVMIGLSKDYFGELSKYGIIMPEKGPFIIKATTGRSAVIDVGTIGSIKDGLIKDGELLNEEGFPKQSFPNHWKGKNGVYCAGLSKRGLAGIAADAQNIAKDISTILLSN